MALKRAAISKITKPRVSKVYPRKRLFRLLDRARNKPVVWINGPAGSGKTTLVASYLDDKKIPCLWYQLDERDSDIATFFYYMRLAGRKAAPHRKKPLPLFTPEYSLGIPTFSKRYFEDLFIRLKTPFALVFDNYQEVAFDSMFHQVIQEALGNVPEGVRVIVASREEPVPQLARLQATQAMEIIGWRMIRFTLDEYKEIIKIHRDEGLTKKTTVQLYQMTQGWISGLILLLQRSRVEGIEPGSLTDQATIEVLDYFSNEVFKNLDKDDQIFLMKTALLPQMSPRMAQALSGVEDGDRLLSELGRRNIFIEKRYHPELSYQYHPLFRDFLLRCANDSISLGQIARLKKHAGEILEASGHIEDAVELYIQSGDWESLIQLILKEAPSLITQGRNQTLSNWIHGIPENVVNETSWLLYWLGVTILPYGPKESQKYFEKAFEQFKVKRDTAGICLAWSGVVDAILWGMEDYTQFDPWIKEFEGLRMNIGELPSQTIEASVAYSIFYALLMRQPSHSEIEQWAEKVLYYFINSTNKDVGIQSIPPLITYYTVMGNKDKLAHVLNSIDRLTSSKEVSPAILITARLAEGQYCFFKGFREKRGIEAISEGLKLANDSGVHIFDSLLLGTAALQDMRTYDLKSAGTKLKMMSSILSSTMPFVRSYYHYLRTIEAFTRGDLLEATEHVDLALKLVLDVGAPYNICLVRLSKAQILHKMGNVQEARENLDNALKLSAEIKSKQFKYLVLMVKAQFAIEEGDETSGLKILRQALKLGNNEKYIYTPFDQTLSYGGLCVVALENNVEVDYVTELINERRIILDKPPLHLENWPWPIKVFTFGRFGLIIDGKPFRFPKRAQQRPLDMLKVLISLGGRETSEEAISDFLWPDADGDMAQRSFKTTLHRLRKLIGYPEAIIYSERKVTLNQQYCWTDVWAFERLIGEADEAWNKTPTEGMNVHTVELRKKAIDLYKGPFLSFEKSSSWSISMRERLKNKYLRNVFRLGHHYEENGKLGEALLLYQRSIEVENLVERFYERLMVCYQRMGQKSMALGVYQQCKEVLESSLGVGPSKEIEDLREAVFSEREIST